MFGKVNDRDLFDYALLNPCESDETLNTLHIVSGYASHALAAGHLSILKSRKKKVDIDLVHGMAGVEGVDDVDFKGFISLHNHEEFNYDGNFNCRYARKPLSIHSKIYVWCKGGTPVRAFIGSANYTNLGFRGRSRVETLSECDPISANEFFLKCKSQTILCHRASPRDFLKKKRKPVVGNLATPVVKIETNPESPFYGYERMDVDLRNQRGHFGVESGLNWGLGQNGLPRLQNKGNPNGGRRDPDEAYIRFPKRYDCGFFPPYVSVPKGKDASEAQIRFSVLTDDNELFSCIRASGGYGKEIETPQDNAELGRWFRKRLGVASGTLITDEIMKAYGRETVTFYKLADDQFFMDFSCPPTMDR